MGLRKKAGPYISAKELRFQMVFFILNTFFLMIAVSLIGLGIWFVIERTYIASVLDNDLYAVAAIMMFIVGITLLLIIGVGCLGVYRRTIWMIGVYVVIVGILEIIVFVAVVLAIYFSAQFELLVKDAMAQTLIFRYGNNTHNITRNRLVTQAWDTMQVRLKCCAVEDEGWAIYQESSWYRHKVDSGQEVADIPVIPDTCCRRLDRDWDFILNREACVLPQAGPPRTKSTGSVNKFLHYNGCFETGQDSILEVIWIVLGFGLFLFVLVFISLVCAVMVAIYIRRERKRRRKGKYREERPESGGYNSRGDANRESGMTF